MKLVDFPELQSLSPIEKIELASELWLDVAGYFEEAEVTPGEKQLLDERWSAFLQDPAAALDVTQLKERVRTIRK